jgi:predicted flavoprotein YhiN
MDNKNTIPINMLPDKTLETLLEKYTEKNERYKHFVNEESDRADKMVLMISAELKEREDQRRLLHAFNH